MTLSFRVGCSLLYSTTLFFVPVLLCGGVVEKKLRLEETRLVIDRAQRLRSNGLDVVLTDSDGRYQLNLDDRTIVFVTKPAGWAVPLSEDNLPQFFYRHYPTGTPAELGLRYPGPEPSGPLDSPVDFPLRKVDEPDRFEVIWFSDPQPQTPAEIDYIRDDVIAGHIQLGMTVDEVLIATDTTPYGPKRYIGKFWCNNQTVDRCATTCRSCEGMLILKDQLVWFSGHSQPPTVINIEQRSRQESIFSSAPSQQFQIAQALYRNEIIQGMSFTDVSRVINSYTTKPQVFCDNDSAHISPTCDTSCKICRIEILSQSSNTVTKVIVLEPYLGQHRVTRIEQ